MINWADADCHYGDHFWGGTSQCNNCGARLRCNCGVYMREDSIEKHMDNCLFLKRLDAASLVGASTASDNQLQEGEKHGRE